MIDEIEFKEICSDKGFWRHNMKSSLIPYQKVNKEELIENLFRRINTREYYPSPPKDYLILNKGNNVLRVVPVFKLDDLCAYFYYARKLEKYIAHNRVPGTYGGWSLSGITRTEEKKDLAEYEKESVSVQEHDGDQFIFLDMGEYGEETNFNPLAWRASWNEFTSKIYKSSIDYQGDFVAELDIANFYDSIKLDHLEYIIRSRTKPEDNAIVCLLFHFLKYWNRHNNFYVNQNAGLPQDLFGECSRILANFYLQSYDHQMYELCNGLGGKYFRYADDQIIFAKSKKDIGFITAKASSFLTKIGLNINQKKVSIKKKREFNHYFAFDALMGLGGKGDKKVACENIDNAIDFYLLQKSTLRARGRTLIRAILSCLSKTDGKPSRASDLFALMLTEEFLSTHPPSYVDYKRMYAQATSGQKEQLLALLNKTSKSCLHTAFLFHYRKFLAHLNIDFSHVQEEINRVNSMYDLKGLMA